MMSGRLTYVNYGDVLDNCFLNLMWRVIRGLEICDLKSGCCVHRSCDGCPVRSDRLFITP